MSPCNQTDSSLVPSSGRKLHQATGFAMQQGPIFVLGCGRSGTTLLRTMLNHHPDIAIPLESLFVIDYLRVETRCDIETLKSLFIREYELHEWGLGIQGHELRQFGSVPDIIRYAHEKYAKCQGKSRWGQKTPRFIRYVEKLVEAYPDALFVHVIRDPRAVAASLRKSRAHRSNALFAAKRWVRDVQAGLEAQNAFPDRFIEVRYEDLVCDTMDCLRRVCDFLNVRFSDKMIDYTDTGCREYSNCYYQSLHKRLRDKPDKARVDAWRNSLTSRSQRIIEAISRPLMAQLRYTAETKSKSVSRWIIVFFYLERAFGILLQLRYYVLYRRGYIYSFVTRKIRLRLIRDLLQING